MPDERRKILQNGIEAAQFQEMDGSTQNWHLYSQINTLAGYMGGFIKDDFVPVREDVGKLKKFKRSLIIGLSCMSAFLCGLGILEYKTVLKYIAKVLM